MVADTLALVKKEKAAKPVVSVALCGLADASFLEMIELILQQELATKLTVEFKFFSWTNDFIEAARRSRSTYSS